MKLYEKHILLIRLLLCAFDELFFTQVLSNNINLCTQALKATNICWVKSNSATIFQFSQYKTKVNVNA